MTSDIERRAWYENLVTRCTPDITYDKWSLLGNEMHTLHGDKVAIPDYPVSWDEIDAMWGLWKECEPPKEETK